MDEQEKKKIRPLYSEFQGYLSQAPTTTSSHDWFSKNSQWEYVNHAIDLLNAVTGNDYNRFKIVQELGSHSHQPDVILISTFKGKLGGLISNLYGEYFSDEPSPLNGVPSTVINQNLSQQQSVNVLILEMQKKIDEKLATTEDEQEKGFLKKLEKLLPTITNGVQLAKTVLDLTAQLGLDPHQISRLFS